MSTRFRHRLVVTVGVTAGLFVLGRGGLGGLCGHGGGSASAEGRKAVDAQLQRRVSAAVTQGRKLAEQSKYAEAIAAFQSALALAPTTPSALSELGLAHYHLKQYPQAEAALHRALKATTAPAQRGRALYNLGLILEAKGDAKGASAAYKESLSARANQVVLERLRKLDGAAAAAFDPVAPRRFSGPFPTLKDTCAALNDCQQRAAAETSSAGLDYTCKSKKPLLTVARPAAPYRAVQLIETICGDDDKERGSGDSESRIHLLVQSGSGWFATDVGGKVASERTSTFTDFTARELRLTAGPAGAPRSGTMRRRTPATSASSSSKCRAASRAGAANTQASSSCKTTCGTNRRSAMSAAHAASICSTCARAVCARCAAPGKSSGRA